MLHPKKVGSLPVHTDTSELKQTNEIGMAIPLLDGLDLPAERRGSPAPQPAEPVGGAPFPPLAGRPPLDLPRAGEAEQQARPAFLPPFPYQPGK